MLKKEDILKLTRSEIRYKLYRIRTSYENGNSHNSNDIKNYYEKQKGFTKWTEFARIWDIDEEGRHYRIIRRSMTEEEEWLETLKENGRDIIVGSDK